ncbi:MAG: TonB-dependent receptor [Bacteroidaceae bacterium]|nr:TonB-dependent receptor [Bacteroidaceae bacterium]
MKQLLSLILAMSTCACHTYAQSTEPSDTLREVVVTGTGTRHLLKDAPVHTEVISRRMLDSYGGKSIEDILGGLTASFAFSEGDMGSQMQLGGLGNSYILILIDGKRIHGDVGGENDLGLIDPHNIERIEIVKGAQSALYGSDAMAGVINIITKRRDKESLTIENTTRYGSYNDLRQHNGFGFSIGRLSSYTNFQLQHTDGWQNTADEWTEATVVHDSRNKTVNRYTNWQLAERLDYSLSRDLTFHADGTYYIKNISRPTDGNYPSCDVYTYNLMYNNASAGAGAKWTLPDAGLGRNRNYVTLDVDWNKHAYYYRYTHRTYEDAYIDGNLEHGIPFYPGQRRLQSDQHRLMAELKGVFYLPLSNTINTGLEYRYDYLNAPMRTESGHASDWTGALYLQDEFDFIPWLNVTAGIRLVDNGSYGMRLCPKVSTMLSAGDWRFRLGWSQGFKTPTVKELHYRYLHVMGSSTFFNIGNTSLRPQTSNYTSANIEYRGSRFTASATAYLNSLDHMIALVNVPVGEIPAGITTAYLGDGSGNVQARMYKNMEDARTYGIDLNLSYQPLSELTLTAAYSYLNTDAHQYNATHDRLDKVIIDGTAHHKWSASALWQHRLTKTYRLGINLSTRGSSLRYYQNNGNGSPFQIWRINTTHELGRTNRKLSYKLEAGVDNIFNYVDRTMHPYHLGTTSAGTTIYASFAIRFQQGKKINTNIKKQTTYEED